MRPNETSAERILLVEPDAELREIVMAELLAAKLKLPVSACSLEDLKAELRPGTVVVTLPSKPSACKRLWVKTACFGAKVSSAAGSLAEHLPKADPATVKTVLIGLASRWPQFMEVGHTMLLAAGVEGEALVMRDAREPGWTVGLETTSAVVCDCATAQRLPRGARALVFRLVAEESIQQLRAFEPV